jgi:hypothetical protein
MNGLAECDHVRIADDVAQSLQVGIIVGIPVHRSDGMRMIPSPLTEGLSWGVLTKERDRESKRQQDETT